MNDKNRILQKNNTYIDYVNDDTLSIFLDKMKIEINGCGRWISNNSSSIRNFVISDYELVYLIEGGTFLSKNGITYEVNPGSILLLEPNTIFSASTKNGTTTSYYYIHFNMYPIYLIYEFYKLIGFYKTPIILHDSSMELLPVFRQAVEESLSQRTGYKTIISYILSYILIRIIRNKELDSNIVTNINKVNSTETNIIDDATEYIAMNIYDNLKVSSVAKYVNVSENYLYKVFMKLLGISPSKYIKDCKINRSMQLLQTGEFTIKEISANLSFSSPYHFSNTFKSYTGYSPSKYVEQYNNVLNKQKL